MCTLSIILCFNRFRNVHHFRPMNGAPALDMFLPPSAHIVNTFWVRTILVHDSHGAVRWKQALPAAGDSGASRPLNSAQRCTARVSTMVGSCYRGGVTRGFGSFADSAFDRCPRRLRWEGRTIAEALVQH